MFERLSYNMAAPLSDFHVINFEDVNLLITALM